MVDFEKRILFVFVFGPKLLFVSSLVVTSINHYNPGLYLHLSLHWRRIPVLCFQFLLAFAVLGLLEVLGDFNGVCMPKKTKKSILRFVLPLLILNLVLQLGVVVDSYWGWRRVWRRVMTLCRSSNTVHPGSVELGEIQQQVEQSSVVHISNLPKVTSFLNIIFLLNFLYYFILGSCVNHSWLHHLHCMSCNGSCPNLHVPKLWRQKCVLFSTIISTSLHSDVLDPQK